MSRSRTIAWFMLVLGLAGMLGLGFWQFWQVRSVALSHHRLWVRRVADLVMAERRSAAETADRLGLGALHHPARFVAETGPFAAALLVDTDTHESVLWAIPELKPLLQRIDPRLVVLELKALDGENAVPGPLLILHKTPYATAVKALDGNHVLVVWAPTPRLTNILETETRLWHYQTFVYDSEQNAIFASTNRSPYLPAPRVLVPQAVSGSSTGFVTLEKNGFWRVLATYHYDAPTDLVFVIIEPFVWIYTPLFFFAVSLLGVLVLTAIPWNARHALRQRHDAMELGRFAVRVDHFVRGRDPSLPEPPYPYKELMPIVHSLRWLMPQWKKAEAFPRDLALERKLLSLLIESLPEAILFFNPQGGMQLSNELGRVFMA
ncbi:MAG TPA: hypothetical protein VMU17_07335, partial [Elusimicrobiota bacterium]|nr:hypothetical protein [Elusimicrobiota bacterium]